VDTKIPIRNLYYLLCYAWDRLDERDLMPAGEAEAPRDVVNLLAAVLCNATRSLIRRGFERGYRGRTEEIPGIRGRIDVGATVRRHLPEYGRAVCEFDELEHDTPANRVIRATLSYLSRSHVVEEDRRHDLISLLRHFRDVADVRVTERDCRRIVIHRNNRHYGFVVDLCAFILGHMLPDESGRGQTVPDFTRDHRLMARLFEAFVRNFYDHHRAECGIAYVSNRSIPWNFSASDDTTAGAWPGMQSDICLYRPGAPMVIDCKFYHDVLKTGPYGAETLSSANLYQLFTYTQNLAAVPGWENVEGLLLYAENGDPVEISRHVCSHRLRAATVDLSDDWDKIHKRLVGLVNAMALAGATRSVAH
jgi:5-methylcytosine-specific restriction enzyme subunit McrC